MVQNKRLSRVVAAMALAPLVVNAHMIMASPKPYGNPSKSPLDASGSNFPCQNVAYTGASNPWPVGSTQMLTFQPDNTATHGGGSCQISVTSDSTPNKNSKWKVIHSIEGGCPADSVANLAAGEKLGQFPFSIPKSLPNGNMSMAWTWFNRIGNREMYMNCAPVSVTGGSSDMTAFNALPDMVVANINVGTGSTCKTQENYEYTFANPGTSVFNGSPAGRFQFVPICGGTPSKGPSANSPNAPAGSAAASISTPASTMQTVLSPSAPSGTLVQPSAVPTPAQSYTALAPAPAPVQPSIAPSAPAPAPAPSTGGSSSSSNSASSCSPHGAVVCQGESRFAICNFGVANFMPVAQGTACKNGQILKRNLHMHPRAHRRH